MTLNVNGLKVAEAVRNVYQITAAAGTTPEELVDPKYWVHVSRRLRQGDRVEVIASDGSWYGELRVMEVGKDNQFGSRLAFTLGPVALANAHVLPALNDYQARPVGSSWQVFKSGQAEPVKVDLPDQLSADKWIASQRRALAA